MREAKVSRGGIEYGAQAFQVERRRLRPQAVRGAASREAALRLGERLALSSAGVVVFARPIAPEIGECERPRILAAHGQLPPEVHELAAA